MGEIHKLIKEGITLYPATTTDAVVHPQIRTELSNLITTYNVTALFPTSGSGNSSKYTLQSAISLLSSKLLDNQKIPGIKIVFCDIISHETQEWRYLGDTFTDTNHWAREDSWYITAAEESSNIEDLLVNDVLRKSRQSLTENEKYQVKDNLGIQLNAETIDWYENNLNYYLTPGIYVLSGKKTKNSDNIPIKLNEIFSGVLVVNKNNVTIGQDLTITTELEVKSFNRFYNVNTDTWSNWNQISQEINLGEITLSELDKLTKEGLYRAVIRDPLFDSDYKYVKIEVLTYNFETSQTLYLINSSPLIRKQINGVWSDFIKFITTEDLYTVQDELDKLKKAVETLQLKESDDYCVASWDPNDLKPECDEVFGNLDFCNQWNFFLIDTTDNSNETTKPVGKLMKNNLLRFEDGSWAPTICISEARRAECDVSLFFKDGSQYCLAGEFNPIKFYDEYGITTKLYNAARREVNILRPWETTETKYTIGVGREKTIFLLDNIKGKSGKKWKGIFTKPVIWDGIDISKFELKPTAISPCPSTVIKDSDGLYKTRNFFYLYTGNSSCKGLKGFNTNCTLFYSNNRSYPASTDLEDINSGHKSTQINAMKWSRNNNSDITKPVPFGEGGLFAFNAYITSYELYYNTKYLHDENRFTGGICNCNIDSENSWKNNGGIRFKISNTENNWEYASWGQTLKSKNLYTKLYNTEEEKNNESVSWSSAINNQGPKEACMESQMAGSYAKEINIPENTEFDFYGHTYWYKNVPSTKGLEDGLNIILYKKISGTLNVYNQNNEPVILDIEVILRIDLVNGVRLGGDTFTVCGGGYELVGTNILDYNPNFEPDKGNYPIKIYLEPDQKNWLFETESRKINNYFEFETNYVQLIEDQNNLEGSGYCLERIPYTNFPTKKGGSYSNGECSYIRSGNNWSYEENQEGTRVRIMSQLGYISTNSSIGYRSTSIRNATDYVTQVNTVCTQIRLSEETYPLS